jgi:protein SCO1/2
MLSRRALLGLVLASGLLAACERKQARQAVTSSGTAAIGGPFALLDQDGRTVTEKALLGHWSVVYFGYTYCPDVCPMGLQALAQALEKLGRKGEAIRTFLVTVDPERDTPAQLKQYIQSPAFPKNMTGLTGSPEAVAAAAKAYRFYYRKAGEGPDYLVDHAAMMYLMGPDGTLARPLGHTQTPDELATQIRDAMRA